MGYHGDKKVNERSERAHKKALSGLRTRQPAVPDARISWGSVSDECMSMFLDECAKSDASVTFGTSRAGDVLRLTIFWQGDQERFWLETIELAEGKLDEVRSYLLHARSPGEKGS